jgi:hypothetical protein
MIYDEYLTQAELQRWILEADVAWARIDLPLARSRPDVLEQVRDSALIESYFPVYTTRLMRALWDQVDVTSVFSIQLYESYKHFYVLNRYLELVDAHPIADEELVEVRRRYLDTASISRRISFSVSPGKPSSPCWRRLPATLRRTSSVTASSPSTCSMSG